MITEDYVSFEIGKLLKEKGFDCSSYSHYRLDNGELCHFNTNCSTNIEPNNYITAPTLQMAMKWLREVHNLHIIAYPWKADREEKATHWCCQVYKSFNLLGYKKYTDETPKSYEEACETAIKYCLENLI